MHLPQLTRIFVVYLLLGIPSSAVLGFDLTGQSWPPGTTVTMQLEPGPTGVSLIDGLGTWNNSAADALALWNQHLDAVKFNWVLDSTAPKEGLDGYNSVFFSSTILGEGFGDDTLAATVVWYNTDDYGTAVEADVVFNTSQSFNSYRGPLLPNNDDFHRVALHEFGHVLGLAHVYNYPPGQALMEPIVSDLDHLASDDIAGAVFLYSYRITSIPQFDGYVVGEPASFTFTANNNPTSFTVVGLPSGLTLDPMTGEVTGTPLEAGTFEVTITAHGSPRDVSATVTVIVNVAQITSTSPEAVQVGTPVTYTITAGNDPTSFTATELPPGLVLNAQAGVISGVPTLDGSFSVSVVAKGAQYDASGVIGFAILPAYRATIAQLFAGDTIIRTVQDPVRDRLYVLTQRALDVIDTQLQTIVRTVPMNFPFDLSLSVDNSKVWVTEATSIHAYSLTDFSRLPDIPNGPFSNYQQVREGGAGNLYVTNPPGASGTYKIDIATGAVTPIRVAMPGYDIEARIDTSPDGRNLYTGFIDGFAAITRYDISSGAAVELGTRTLITPNLFDLAVSPDGKLLSYSTDNESSPGDRAVFTFPATNLGAAATRVDPTAENSFFNFGAASTAYGRTGVNTGYFHYRLDFINAANGFPYNSWSVVDFGPAFADHSGTNLYLAGYDTIYVYSLAPDGSPGVGPAPKSLLNVSTRSVVGVDDQRMIGGFIITGDVNKEIAFRAIGPTLPVIGPMSDPAISVYDSSGGLVATNKNWNQYRDQIVNAGLAPFDEHEAALIVTLAPGSYTAVVSFENGGTGGIGLVELYDLSSNNAGKIANISTRSKVGTDDNVMIGGFIIGGKEVANVIARAIGPSLAGSVTGVLLNPVLELYNSDGVQIASNDDWRSDQEAEIAASGLPPSDNRESAVLISLSPGSYTAIVRGKESTAGIALVEIYNLDAPSLKTASAVR